jgi:hypothetical protein
MSVVDAVPSAFIRVYDSDSGQFDHLLVSQIADNPVMIEAQFQLSTNQSRGHSVKNTAHFNGAATAHASG